MKENVYVRNDHHVFDIFQLDGQLVDLVECILTIMLCFEV